MQNLYVNWLIFVKLKKIIQINFIKTPIYSKYKICKVFLSISKIKVFNYKNNDKNIIILLNDFIFNVENNYFKNFKL